MTRENKAISFLEKHCFDSLNTIFPFSLILNSLNEIQSFKMEKIKKKLAGLLVKEKNNNQSFNYWFKDSINYLKEPYPNDLDDTFCVWTALFNHDPSLLDVNVFLALTKLLASNQQVKTGPYYTWIVDHQVKTVWSDVDLVVNLNIAKFLHLQNINLKGLNKYIDEKIKSSNLSSIYYKGELPSLYFLSYFYTGQEKFKLKNKLKYYLQQKIEGSSVLLLYISILRFGFLDLLSEEDFKIIFSLQKLDGSVAGFDFYKYNNKLTGEKFYKSDLLSTALFLELLNLIKKNLFEEKRKVECSELIDLFKQRISVLGNNEVEQVLLKRALPVVHSKASNLTLFLVQRLMRSTRNKTYLPRNIVLSLSLVNLFAWIAYTIYDHINDGEGDLESLPLANLATQFLLREFSNFPSSNVYLQKISELFSFMEINNLRENKTFRFEDNFFIKISQIKEDDLNNFSFQKSSAQVFSLYFFLDHLRLEDQKVILKIFKNIILLKQINDDLRDCFTDLQNKQINLVNYFLLKEFNKFSSKESFFLADEKLLKEIFFIRTAPLIFTKISNLIKESNILLKKQKLLKKDNFFMKILSDYEKILMEDRRKNTHFINLSK